MTPADFAPFAAAMGGLYVVLIAVRVLRRVIGA